MRRRIVQTQNFAKEIGNLIRTKRLSQEDFEVFKKKIAENPKKGNIIPGTGGIRKIRLKSTSKGTRGGFRVCYFNSREEEIFLLLIYSKNVQENLTARERKVLKQFTSTINKR